MQTIHVTTTLPTGADRIWHAMQCQRPPFMCAKACSAFPRTHEHGGIIAAWHHALQVRPIGERTCHYGDTVGIDAGRATAAVAVALSGSIAIGNDAGASSSASTCCPRDPRMQASAV